MSWAIPVASLSEALVTGGTPTRDGNVAPGLEVMGTTVNWREVRAQHFVQATVANFVAQDNSEPSYVIVSLYGSLDNKAWYILGQSGPVTVSSTGPVAGGTINLPALHVQARVIAYTGSGAAVPVSAVVSAVVTSR